MLAHDPVTAASQRQRRKTTLDALVADAEALVATLDAQDAGHKRRGRRLSDGGATARLYHAVCDARLSRILRVDLKSELFRYEIDEAALVAAQMMDGKLLLVSNVPDLDAATLIERYKALADIERGFKVLKSEIEIGPVYHRLPERIRAHATLCFMALILYRVMRQHLRAAHSPLSPERALEQLRRIQHHRVRLNQAEPISGISSISAGQGEVFQALKVRKPTIAEQLTLL